jgi:hypothetical protein
MNIHYPVSRHINRSLVWLLAASIVLASLILAVRIIAELQLVEYAHPLRTPANPAVLRPVPVPEPPQSQPAPHPQACPSPVSAGDPLHPAPQPVPVAPDGK